MERPTVLGEGWRIEDNQVVLVASLFQILESILAKSLMTLIAREIQLHIAVGELDSLGTAVDRMDELCSTPHGIE